MASMTDLIFLMLIFFIIMSTKSAEHLPIDLPSSNTTSPSSEVKTVEIGIGANNLYFFDFENPENYTFEEVVPVLDQKMRDSGGDGLKISGERSADYELIFNVIALAKQRGWKPVLSYD